MTVVPGMSAARKRFGLQKFVNTPCTKCGSPNSVINGAWLKHERELAGLTLREMGQRMGCTAPFLSDVEHNRRNCSPKTRAAYEALRRQP